MSDLVLGMDVGGTSSRAVIADLDGRILGRGTAGGGNPTSRGVGPAMTAIGAAIEGALAGGAEGPIDRARLRGNVIGAAGFGATNAYVALADTWQGLELPGEPVLVGDVEVAFASGSDALDGSILIAGTGGVAAAIIGGTLGPMADGLGWMLGDHGSGYWLGREAIRRTLLPARDPADPLGELVAQRLTGAPLTGDWVVDRLAILTAAYALEPVRLSELAADVVAADEGGSRQSDEILASAADELVTTLAGVHRPDDGPVVVIGGGLLGSTRLGELVADHILARWPRTTLSHTGSGAGGAAWLAARNLRIDLPASVHAALTRS